MIFDKDFKKNFKIEGFRIPFIFTSVVDGQKYAISGSNWIEIPDDMTIEEVRAGFIDKSPKRENKKEITKIVESSKGKTNYKVSFKDGSWKCTCSGYTYRRKCSHIDVVKNELKELL